MSVDEIKKAEARGYAKGYQAGKRRKQNDRYREKRAAMERAFWQRAFLAAIPTCMELQGWTIGGRPISTSDERVAFASRVANEALDVAIRKGKIA